MKLSCRMKTKILRNALLIVPAIAVMLMTGCKPTENNYRTAYEAALAKRERAVADADMGIPEGGLISLDGPRTRDVGGETVYVESRPLQLTAPSDVPEGGNVAKDAPHPERYNVVVGKYRMATNAIGQVGQLKGNGYAGAFPAHSDKDTQYAVAAAFDSIEEAAVFIRDFKSSNPEMKYVGLPDAPVIIENTLK